jgi:hypothetical protein
MNVRSKVEGRYGGREDETRSYAVDEEAQPLRTESIGLDDFGAETTSRPRLN